MTIAPEREDLSELDFDTPNMLEEPDFDVSEMGQEVIGPLPDIYGDMLENVLRAFEDAEMFRREHMNMFTDEPWALRGNGPYQYCYCSPSRGMLFDRHREPGHYMEWPEPVRFERWEMPEPPVMSKALVVIP